MAAELQRRHELEGAPDPFPSLSGAPDRPPAPARAKQNGPSNAGLDTSSDAAFPTLSASSNGKPVSATVSWGSGPRVQSAASNSSAQGSQTVILPSIDLSQVAAKGKAPTLLEYQKSVGSKFRVQITSTQQRTTGQTTFIIKAESEKDIAKARKHLIVTLSPTVTIKVEAPNSTLPSIIGPGGATIKSIRDKTNARIDVPRREEPSQPADGERDEDDEPTTTITITAPQPLAHEAKLLVDDIISSKRAKSAQRIRDVPDHIVPFITPRKADFLAAASGVGEVALSLDRSTNTFTATGDREAVKLVTEAMSTTIEGLKTSLQPLRMPLPKKQHRLLTQAVISDIMAKTRCSVTVPAADDPSDQITVWGNISQGTDISSALQTVLTRVNSQHAHEFTIPSSIGQSAMVYFNRVGYTKTLQAEHPKVAFYMPTKAQIEKQAPLTIDLVGDKEAVGAAADSLSHLFAELTSGTRAVEIDHLRHRLMQNKGLKRLRQLHETEKVLVHFPEPSAESSTLLLFIDPSLSLSSDQKVQSLNIVQEELLKLADDTGDFKSQTILIEQKWHDALRGTDGTTLNAILGNDRTLSIKFASDTPNVANGHNGDAIHVRGHAADVDRAVKDIHRIVETVKTDGIDSNYTVEFDVPRDYVGRIVGTGGGAVNKLRDDLGVKLDFTDETEEKDKETSKKKKATSGTPSGGKASVKINGRKENVEEAKRRIMNQVDKLTDETSEILKIPNQYHSSLIGAAGKYVIRLEEKYGVKITFPREGGDGEPRTREALNKDEVLVKGGRKGVAAAKSELVEAFEFEKESNNTLQFYVPTKAVARILGKGGATIHEIKDSTDAQIDVDKTSGDQTKVTVKGTKKAIAAAKIAILAIAEQVGDEISEIMHIDSKYHRAIIGVGGQALKEMIAKCGGPSESRAQAGLVHFPRPGEKADEIQLRGEATVVKKLKAELEKAAASFRDRVVLGVSLPAVQHKALIGRGGQHLTELQTRIGVQIQFPGSRSYQSVGDPENLKDLGEVDPANLVKVMGPRAACTSAIDELSAKIRSSENKSQPSSSMVEGTVTVPLKYQQAMLQHGNLMRQLRTIGAQLEQSSLSKTASSEGTSQLAPQPAARIDDDAEASSPASQTEWSVVENYQGAAEGSSEWVLKARDQEALDKAQDHVKDALKHAELSTHVGTLTLPNRNAFPRIVGTKGANVARLRAETGAEITVSREDNSITIAGTRSAVEDAKTAILSVVSSLAPRGRGDRGASRDSD